MTNESLESRITDLETLVARLNNTNSFGELRYGQPDISPALNTDLATEIARATAAEGTLTTNLSTLSGTVTALGSTVSALGLTIKAIGANSASAVNSGTSFTTITSVTVSVPTGATVIIIAYAQMTETKSITTADYSHAFRIFRDSTTLVGISGSNNARAPTSVVTSSQSLSYIETGLSVASHTYAIEASYSNLSTSGTPSANGTIFVIVVA